MPVAWPRVGHPSSDAGRSESEPALISANFFISTGLWKQQKNKTSTRHVTFVHNNKR